MNWHSFDQCSMEELAKLCHQAAPLVLVGIIAEEAVQWRVEGICDFHLWSKCIDNCATSTGLGVEYGSGQWADRAPGLGQRIIILNLEWRTENKNMSYLYTRNNLDLIIYKGNTVTSSRLGASPLDPLVRPPMTYILSRQVTAVCMVRGFSMAGAAVHARVTGQKHQTSSVASWSASATWRRIVRQQVPRQPPVTNIWGPLTREKNLNVFKIKQRAWWKHVTKDCKWDWVQAVCSMILVKMCCRFLDCGKINHN